jgi:hypothetical protein
VAQVDFMHDVMLWRIDVDTGHVWTKRVILDRLKRIPAETTVAVVTPNLESLHVCVFSSAMSGQSLEFPDLLEEVWYTLDWFSRTSDRDEYRSDSSVLQDSPDDQGIRA